MTSASPHPLLVLQATFWVLAKTELEGWSLQHITAVGLRSRRVCGCRHQAQLTPPAAFTTTVCGTCTLTLILQGRKLGHREVK